MQVNSGHADSGVRLTTCVVGLLTELRQMLARLGHIVSSQEYHRRRCYPAVPEPERSANVKEWWRRVKQEEAEASELRDSYLPQIRECLGSLRQYRGGQRVCDAFEKAVTAYLPVQDVDPHSLIPFVKAAVEILEDALIVCSDVGTSGEDARVAVDPGIAGEAEMPHKGKGETARVGKEKAPRGMAVTPQLAKELEEARARRRQSWARAASKMTLDRKTVGKVRSGSGTIDESTYEAVRKYIAESPPEP